ncbi:discoidin domain-containing protein [Thermocatellispora tengchongensis]|uniref:discoidin domain-containing protein n=1 Tax=Thermocatellispora tengchongensis TaxID=1073253 RepID=UPI00363ECCF8
MALNASVTASSTLRADTPATEAVDGRCGDDSRWISAEGDTAPTLTVDLGRAVPIDSVRVRSGYSKAPDPGTDVLRSFTVQLRVDGAWREAGAVTGNTSPSSPSPPAAPPPTRCAC